MLLCLFEMQIIIAFALNSLMRRPRVARREEGCYSKQGRNGAELFITNMGFVSWDGMLAAGLDGLRRRKGGASAVQFFHFSKIHFTSLISLCPSLHGSQFHNVDHQLLGAARVAVSPHSGR